MANVEVTKTTEEILAQYMANLSKTLGNEESEIWLEIKIAKDKTSQEVFTKIWVHAAGYYPLKIKELTDIFTLDASDFDKSGY